MYGRKRFFIFGLALFLLGSILCGTAQNIVQLSIYRAIQGMGGGALVPIAFTILFDIFPPEKRGKMSGIFGAIFGLSSLFGPLLGAYITDNLDWRWIFYINLPLGTIALAFIIFSYKESLEHTRQKIDWAGVFTLVPAVVCLMFALELGGNKYDWDSGVILGLFAGFVLFTILFFIAEAKAQEPIISFQMFKVRLFSTSTAVGIFSGAAFIAATMYIPLFVQGVTGGTATNSGLILLPMMLGTVVGAQAGGFLSTKTNYRSIVSGALLIFVVGVFLLGTLTTETPKYMLTIYMILVGIGLGPTFSVVSMAAIHHFDFRTRGSASSTLSFLRSLGMTLGITIFGILQRNEFTAKLTDLFAGMGQAQVPSIKDPRAVLAPELRSHIPKPVLDKITAILATSISYIFKWALIPALLAFAFAFLMSKERMKLPGKEGGEAPDKAKPDGVKKPHPAG